MTIDADELRKRSRESWERAAAGWGRRQTDLRTWTAPVSQWLVEAIHPQPGHRVLDLAAGPGETGFLAAELIKPGGTLVCSDQSEAMLEVARARAAELGLDNVEFKPIDAEWIDAELASFDSVLCRWGYMLMADPAAALRETRRVLRPGGRVALSVWDRPDLNPWAIMTPVELVERGAMPPPDPEAPGMFALADRDKLAEMLAEGGFSEIEIDAVELEQRHPSFDAMWDFQLDCAAPLAAVLQELDPAELAEVRAAVERRYEPFTAPDGTLTLPASAVVGAATA
jgi:SAM-dependent methyltransferase